MTADRVDVDANVDKMIPIEMLPDEALLSIFDFYVGFYANKDPPTKRG